MTRQMTILFSAIFPALISGGCSGRSAGDRVAEAFAGADTIPAEVVETVKAVATSDSSRFASLVSYPLERPYPLKDIQDSAEMKRYYSVLVDDSLKRKVAESKPADWESDGWRGWSLKGADYLCIDGQIYAVNYVSENEKRQRDELIRRDKESLPKDMRYGWLPEGCLIDSISETVYRIDSDSTDIEPAENRTYRLAVYTARGDLKGHPGKVFKGRKQLEGTEGNILYYFNLSDTTGNVDSAEYVIEAYSQDTGRPRIHHRNKQRDLKKAYWLDLVNGGDSTMGESGKPMTPVKR